MKMTLQDLKQMIKDELELFNTQGETTDFNVGDMVKDINPNCPHHNSEGEVIKVSVDEDGNQVITYKVSNTGDNYKPEDVLSKTGEQLVKLNSESTINEAKETIFDVAVRVMKDKQHQNYKSKVGMVKVDMQSANLLVKVWKKVNPKMKKILSDLGYKNPAGLMKTLWTVAR